MHDHRHLLDWVIWLSTGIAALGINTILTAMAITVSVILGGFRIYDRLRYGPVNRERSQ